MDQNGGQDEEEIDDQHYRSHHNCHKNFIRPSSSSSIRAPSWSSGFGARWSEEGEFEGHDCCCSRTTKTELPEGNTTHCCRCHDESMASNVVSENEHQLAQCPSFQVEIPTVYLTRRDSTNSSSFHVYQVNIVTGINVGWSIYRRYSQFLTLHQQLKACDPAIGKFPFPPKHRLNSKASTIVQERRRKLEDYLRLVCDYVVKRPSSARASTENGPYELLTRLATNGPTRQPRSSLSRQSGDSDLLELAASAGSCSLTDSARSSEPMLVESQLESREAVDKVERAQDVDDESTQTSNCCDEDQHSLSPSSVIVEEAAVTMELASSESGVGGSGQMEVAPTQPEVSKSYKKSLRYLFYKFISPNGTNDAEFKLDRLGV